MSTPDKILARFPNASESFRRLLVGKPSPQVGIVGMPKTPAGVSVKRLRQSATHGLNKLETAAWEYLKREYLTSEVIPHGLTLTIGTGVKYTPDFTILHRHSDRVQCIEVKGPFMREDSGIKLKVAASVWSCFGFTLIWREGRNGAWQTQEILP